MFFSPKRHLERYFKKNPDVKLIVIAGSYGRKSANRALGLVLDQTFTVTMGVNSKIHPDIVIMDYVSSGEFPDVKPDVMVITSCLTDAEAKSFFALANKSQHVIINFNDVPQKYSKYLMNPEVTTYGDELPADYYFENHDFTLSGQKGDIVNPDREHIPVSVKLLGEHNLRPLVMAAAVAKMFQVPREDIVKGIESVRPLHGRMSPGKGLKGSAIIDDSADDSIVSVEYGLKAIYALEAPSRILVTNDADKAKNFDRNLMSEILVLGPNKTGKEDGKIHYFDDELDLINYLGSRFEQGGIVLLEIPLPSIIESYIWE